MTMNFIDIFNKIDAIEQQLSVCTHCGMCMSACPLYAETGREADGPRGKIALLHGIKQGLLNDVASLTNRFSRCLLCGACAVSCPRKINTTNLFLQARKVCTEFLGLSVLEKVVFRKILTHPEQMNRLFTILSRWQFLGLKPSPEGMAQLRFIPSLMKHNWYKPLAHTSFYQSTRQVIKKPFSGKPVGFFVGCLIDKWFPEIAEATLTSLNYHNIDVILPNKQLCCGMPAISSGDKNTAVELIYQNLKLFSEHDAEFWVTSCATCAYTLKFLWPEWVKSEPMRIQEKVQNISKKIQDISQLISRFIKIPPETALNKNATRITYHDPCHLRKKMSIWKEPRTLIQMNTQYQLVEIQGASLCCGFGGSFHFKHSILSQDIGRKKLGQLLRTDCAVVATSCPACMLQIGELFASANQNVCLKHPIQLYAEYLNLNHS
ncbi:MAG: (Fe-S)-binding protein [Desulfobacterales bacterium]|nr:(Fe-S)-binding protein [Desulfobacterales bacterium]